MRRRTPRCLIPLVLVLLATTSACDSCDQPPPSIIDAGGGGPVTNGPDGGTEFQPGDILGEEELAAALKDGQREPLALVVQATKPQPARKTRTLEEARYAVESKPELEPLREALTNGGWDAEQQAQMVYFAGTHMSGAPEDSIRHRQQQLHDEVSAQLTRFRRDLAAAEEETGVKVDREALKKAGVITRLETEVIR